MRLCALYLLGAFAILCGLPAAARAQVAGDAAVSRPLVITSGAHRWSLTAAELSTLARRSVRVAEEGTDSVLIEGFWLWDVLQRVGIPSAEAAGRQRGSTYLRVVGGDGQVAVIALAEVDPSFSQRILLIADRRGGRPLDESEGPWRVIIPDDRRHARWIRQVVVIEVVHVGPERQGPRRPSN